MKPWIIYSVILLVDIALIFAFFWCGSKVGDKLQKPRKGS